MSRSRKKHTAGALGGQSNKLFKQRSNRQYRRLVNVMVSSGAWDAIPGFRSVSDIYCSVTEGYGWWSFGDKQELNKWSRK